MIILVMVFAFPASASALSRTTDSYIQNSMLELENDTSYEAYGYVIDSYHMDIKVNENNSFDITETIEAYFYQDRHGIYRTIPLINSIERLNGTKSLTKAKITDLEVSDTYTASREGKNYKIQIGSENETITGTKQYTIRYNYNIGNDPVKNYDEFYYNLIGTEWDTYIGNITFSITMPKEFDESKLGFSSGLKGSTNNSNITYYVDGNEIIGSYEGVLSPKEGLTVRMELPEGYFVNTGSSINITACLYFFIPVVCFLIALILWFLFGKEYPVVEKAEFYPPGDFNSLEIGYLYKGKATNKDVISLLVYLAHKGYIGISQTVENSLFGNQSSFEFTELKKYDGDNTNEEIFLRGLFRGTPFSSTTSTMDSQTDNADKTNARATKASLYHSFFRTIDVILGNINTRENKKKIFESNRKQSLIILIMIAFCAISMIAIPTLEYTGFVEAIISCFPILFFMPFFAVGLVATIPIWFRLLWVGGTTFVSVLVLVQLPVMTILAEDSIYLMGFLVSIVCIIGMFFCLKSMPRRTKYGSEILGRIKGFKRFLETAEKEKLEAMVMQDPAYFYHILPYTYVLDVSDKWINQFETISLRAPDWYRSREYFNMHNFRRFMRDTMDSAQSVMTSQPSYSSGGSSSSGSSFSSGGGSSGGGSGDGGGGSW